MLGNTKLIEHGIQTEKSDLRAHVGVLAGIVYVFSSKRALRLINNGPYKSIPVLSNINGQKIQTATGYVVPVHHLNPRQVEATSVIKSANFIDGGYESSADKGRKAQWVVEQLLKNGDFPLPVVPSIVHDVEMQRDGFDLVIRGRWRIEVKCDWRAGMYNPDIHGQDKQPFLQLTGNVFLQIAECNPLGMH